MTLRPILRRAERATPDEQLPLLAFAAGSEVAIDPQELNGAIRRAELLLATGGDPRRPLELGGRAVRALAEDLDLPERRAALHAGLEALAADVTGLRGIGESLRLLRADGDLAWSAYALALLADALAADDDDD